MYKPLLKGKQLNRDEIIFSSGSPYPEIDITSRNQAYARQILDNLGGSNSEMSAVCLYFYNHLMTESCSQDIAWIFHKISVVEMRHMEIFGKIALCLGEDPRLWTWRYNRRVYWTPACDRYPVELNRLIYNALNAEQAAVEKYRCQLRCIDQQSIAANLQRIIEDEQQHIHIFRQIIEEYHL